MSKLLNLSNMNQNARAMIYFVSCPVSLRSFEIKTELERGMKKPFTSLIELDIGDPQAMGLKPLSWVRQILAAVAYPQLLNEGRFPSDVKDHATTLLNGFNGKTIGSYTNPSGYMVVKKYCADFITKRDGIICDPETISLCSGVKSCVSALFQILSNCTGVDKCGIMTPIPGYPLYTAGITLMNFHPIHYYLNEDDNWSFDIQQLRKMIKEARKVCKPTLLVVINPSNPTGQLLTESNIREIIQLAFEEKLIIFADEVYQQNIYEGEFISFKKVLVEMGEPYSSMELISVMSTAKGFYGECGIRGAYMELFNICPEIREMISKVTTVFNIPPVMGQVALSCITSPPKPGNPSYNLFNKEKQSTLTVLKERFNILQDLLYRLEGINCSRIYGSIFAFPRIELPVNALNQAKKRGLEPDEFFCLELLNNTGIVTNPGTNFGQKPGTHHFRITNLVSTAEMKDFSQRFEQFFNGFMSKYH